MSGRPLTVRRSPALRALALLSALVLLLAGTTDAYGLHRCAHHDALPGEASSHDGLPGGETSHDGLPGGETSHDGHGSAATADHDDHGSTTDASAPSHDDAGCTCVGDCAASPGLEASAATPAVELHFATTVVAEPAPVDAPRVAHAPYSLPFAQGPPLDL